MKFISEDSGDYSVGIGSGRLTLDIEQLKESELSKDEIEFIKNKLQEIHRVLFDFHSEITTDKEREEIRKQNEKEAEEYFKENPNEAREL